MSRRIQLLIASLPFLLISFSFAQAQTDDKFATPSIMDEQTVNPEQNQMWRSGQSRYSAKPKSMWELGIHAGNAFISGDVEAPFPAGYGVGLHLRKAVNYTLSWRLDATYQSSRGYDARSYNYLASERLYHQNLAEFPQLANYTNELISDDNIHRNYKATILDFSLEAVLNIGNILFHKADNKWNFYTVLGIGLNLPKTHVDLLNDGQTYNFSSVTSGLDLTTKKDRNEARKRLKDLLDGDFETPGGVERDIITFLGDYKTVIPHFHFGMGISRKLSKRINLGLEHRVMVSDNDLLDGFENRTSVDETASNDIAHYTSLRLGINIGNAEKRVEPLYWINPLDGPLNDIAELKQRPKFDLTDSDGDGVIDMIDQEPNSPAGAPVDTRGITLDSDGDGVPDYKDKEPYSPPGHNVNGDGVAQIADPYMKESDVINLINQRAESLSGLNWFLPIIHFDLDKYYVKPEFYGALHNIAAVMNSHPDLKMVATGYADNRSTDEYNNVLSWNRANEVVNYLVNNYNIPRSRFLVNYGGELSPIVDELKDNHAVSRTEEYKHYLNRRVEFRVAKSTDTDQSRPAGPDAGKNTPGSARPGSKYSGNYNSGY